MIFFTLCTVLGDTSQSLAVSLTEIPFLSLFATSGYLDSSWASDITDPSGRPIRTPLSFASSRPLLRRLTMLLRSISAPNPRTVSIILAMTFSFPSSSKVFSPISWIQTQTPAFVSSSIVFTMILTVLPSLDTSETRRSVLARRRECE